MKKLAELVAIAGLAFAGCKSTEPINVPVKTVEQPKVKEIRKDVIEPLREFVYAQYDVALGVQRNDLLQLEGRLEKSLTAANLPASETLQKLREGKRAKALETFFEEQGLQFRSLLFAGFNTANSYELTKIDSKEKKEMTIFGITKEYTKVRIVEPELITNCFTYAAQKNKSMKTSGVSGVFLLGSDIIEYRVWQLDSSAKNYFEGEKAQWNELEAEANDSKILDKYFSRTNKQIYKLFMDHMGTLLHHIGVRDIYKSSNDEADFKSKIAPLWEKDMDIKQVMHLIDDFRYEKEISDKLTKENFTKLAVDTVGQLETRGMLAQMAEGSSPHLYLGDLFKTFANTFTKEMAMQRMASFATLSAFLFQIVAERDKYSNIDVTGYKPGREGMIYQQFGNLSSAQIRTLAKDTYERLYKGSSLRDHMQKRVDELLESQK